MKKRGNRIRPGEAPIRIANHDLERDADTMGKSSKQWPNIYWRPYETGGGKWVVDFGKQGKNKRARDYVDTRAEAEAVGQQARIARTNQGAAAFSLPFDVQSQAIALYEYLKPHGISLHDVQQHYAEKVIPYMMIPKVAIVCENLLASLEGCRPRWHQTMKCFLNEFAGVFGERNLMDITEDELREFCFGPGRGPRTCKNRRAMASQLFNYAIAKWVKKSDNTARNLERPRSKDRRRRVLAVAKAYQLLLVADQFGFLAYGIFAMFGGIRPDEIQRLDWSLVHASDGLIEITEWVSKIHLAREVPINPTMAAWLSLCRRESGPIVDMTNFNARFAAWRTAAGVLDEWESDYLRKAFASYHVAMYKNPNETARIMGHIDGLRTLYRHYVSFVPISAAEQFWALRPPTASQTDKMAA